MSIFSGIPIGGRIGLLLVAAVLPLATLGAIYAWSAGETAREAEMRARYETARVVAGAVESVVEGVGRAADVTLARNLVSTEPEMCRRAALDFIRLNESVADISIVAEGARVCGVARGENDLVPLSGGVPVVEPRTDAVMAIAASQRPAIRVVRARSEPPPAIAVIHVALDPIWRRVTSSIAGLSRARVFVLTESGSVIADPEGVVDAAGVSAILAAVSDAAGGGVPVVQVNAPGVGFVAIARVGNTSLRVAVTSDVTSVNPSLAVRIALVAGLPFLFLVAAVAISWVGVDRIVNRWVRRLSRVTRQYGDGDLSARVGTIPSAPEEFRALGASFDEMATRIEGRSADLERALSEKNHFVRELHHRVKNNFQMIASLLTLQRREADPSIEAAIREAHDRVQALAAAYRASYGEGETGQVPIASLMVDLVERLRESAHLPVRSVAIQDLGDGMSMHLDRAIPFALLMTELLVPLFDAARQSGDALRISVTWGDDDRQTIAARITLQRQNVTTARPLADRLARAYAAQLNATVMREGHVAEVRLARAA